MDGRTVGMLLIGLGVVAIIVGALAMTGALGWFGRLPGDIRIQRGNSSFYFPIVTCLVISVVLSVLAALFRR